MGSYYHPSYSYSYTWESPLDVPSSYTRFVNDIGTDIARVDWKETSDGHVFMADLPGVNKEDVKVEVEEESRVLIISGERKRTTEENFDIWYKVERSCGRFERRFHLPKNAKIDEIKASMENGVLIVSVPRGKVKIIAIS